MIMPNEKGVWYHTKSLSNTTLLLSVTSARYHTIDLSNTPDLDLDLDSPLSIILYSYEKLYTKLIQKFKTFIRSAGQDSYLTIVFENKAALL